MKKLYLLLILLCGCAFLQAQEYYASQGVKLLSISNPNRDSILIGTQKYAGCWGWYQEEKKREYALVGGCNGAYFIDITDPTNPIICDYVPGGRSCVWREIKNFRNYCYVVNDCGSGLEIIDMQYLPDSVHVVSTGTQVLSGSHTIWIDGNKLYCSSLIRGPGNYASIGVYSLSNPELPVFLRSVNTDYSFFKDTHDLFSRNDTIYASSDGIQVLKYDSVANQFRMLGSYNQYNKKGYSHSNFLTDNGKYLIFCDENAGIPVNLIDVSNLENIQPVSTFLPYPLTTTHNPYILGNQIAIVACYSDGIQIYDISDPSKVQRTGFFHTSPGVGYIYGQYMGDSNGTWGAYPFLPSKTLIAIDEMNGAFFLDAGAAYQKVPSDSSARAGSIEDCAIINTIPASKFVVVKAKGQASGKISLSTAEGKLIFTAEYSEDIIEKINTENLPNGCYIIKVGGKDCSVVKKILITHFD
jgi:choice-of-anchor B domain-containing protein